MLSREPSQFWKQRKKSSGVQWLELLTVKLEASVRCEAARQRTISYPWSAVKKKSSASKKKTLQNVS